MTLSFNAKETSMNDQLAPFKALQRPTMFTPKFGKLLILKQRTLAFLHRKRLKFQGLKTIPNALITISDDPTNRYASKPLSTLFFLFTQPCSLSVSFLSQLSSFSFTLPLPTTLSSCHQPHRSQDELQSPWHFTPLKQCFF